MSSVFSRIIKGEISAYKIAEDERYFAFLDVRPLAKGHILVVPKKETDYLFDMEDEELGGMIVFAKKVAKAIKKVIPCTKVGIAVIGLEVAHAHIHLVPINTVSDLNFAHPKLELEKLEMEEIAQKIIRSL